jgi:hypothetical protein
MMVTASTVLRQIDTLTDKDYWDNRCLGCVPFKSHDLESFHRAVEQRAYFAAEGDGFRQPQEVYWKAAKASVALELTGEFGVYGSERFTPSKTMLPLDREDSELIALVMSLPRVRTNLHMFVQGKVLDYLKQKWAA